MTLPKVPVLKDFADFETFFVDFESRVPKIHIRRVHLQCLGGYYSCPLAGYYLVMSRIQAVTLCPMRCLKARLKVL